jgi:predicted nucleic acid-binding protein
MHAVSRAFLAFLRDGDLPYRRLLVNDHIVDETATRLKKQASMPNATTFLQTLERSNLYKESKASASGLDPEGEADT